MDIIVDKSGMLAWNAGDAEHRVRCSLGRGGIGNKEGEGDGITPLGTFPLRAVMVRTDRVGLPETRLPVSKIMDNDGWCDDPDDPDYNTRISLPHSASHEKLSRDDHLYDVIVEVGYNDDPIVSGRGSAIFMHLARENYTPTEGCVGLALEDMIKLLENCDGETRLVVKE